MVVSFEPPSSAAVGVLRRRLLEVYQQRAATEGGWSAAVRRARNTEKD
jgi:hypothetical protein